MPHSEPHRRKTVNPGLGLGSFTNQEVPEANTTAEWKTTSPATTNARITSSSGRLEAAGTDTGPSPCGRSSILTTSPPSSTRLGVRLGILIAAVSVGFH